MALPHDGSPPEQLTTFESDLVDTFAWSHDGRLARVSSTSSVVHIGGFN